MIIQVKAQMMTQIRTTNNKLFQFIRHLHQLELSLCLNKPVIAHMTNNQGGLVAHFTNLAHKRMEEAAILKTTTVQKLICLNDFL